MFIDLKTLCTTVHNLSNFHNNSKLCLHPSETYFLPEPTTSSFGYSNSWFRRKPLVGTWPISDTLPANAVYAYRTDYLVDYSSGILYHTNLPVIQSYGDSDLFKIVYSSIQPPATSHFSSPPIEYPVFVASSRWAQTNYWHWLLDLLPQLLLFIDLAIYEKAPVIHIPSNLMLPYQRQWLVPLLAIASSLSVKSYIVSETYVLYSDAIYIPSLCLPRPTPFLSNLLCKYAQSFFPESFSSESRANLFLLRKPNTHRSALNTHELVAWSRLNNFLPVFLEDYSVAEQIKLLNSAYIVIGMHGAGMANIVFMQPGSYVLELCPSSGYNPAIQDLACSLRLKYGILPFKSTTLGQQYSVNTQFLDAYLAMI